MDISVIIAVKQQDLLLLSHFIWVHSNVSNLRFTRTGLFSGWCRPGITAGKAAGMKVVAVPSVPKQSHLYTLADEVINSLFDLRPEQWGLPPFEDCKL